jgi:hypothetical protein
MKKTVAQSLSLAFILFAAPLVASAQALTPLVQLVASVGEVLNLLIPVLIAAAIVVFFWGLVQYIWHPEIETGRKTMIAGILSLFIMVSIWGIVGLAQNALLGGSSGGNIVTPHVPITSQ